MAKKSYYAITGAGTENQWTASSVSVGDDNSESSTTYSTNPDGNAYYTLDCLIDKESDSEIRSYIIESVEVGVRVSCTQLPAYFSPILWIGEATYIGDPIAVAADHHGGTTWQYGIEWTTNPFTETTWTWEDLDTCRAGIMAGNLLHLYLAYGVQLRVTYLDSPPEV
jgi:hypothetical protein